MSEIVSLTISVSWDDYERLLKLRGDRRVPRLYYDAGKLGLEGSPIDWDESVRDFISDLLEDEEDLLDAIAAEEDSQNYQPISWEQVKQELSLF